MPRKWIKKYLPSADTIRRQTALGPVRHLLLEPELWHLHRRSVGGACFIGLFCAFVPLPVGQMLIAALLAVAARCNLPIAVSLVWITNPLTFAPIFYFAYKLGSWLLGIEVANEQFELSWRWLWTRLAEVWWPLLLGSFVCGWVSGLTGAVVARTLWRLHVVRRWQRRRAVRSARKAAVAGEQAVGDARAKAAAFKDANATNVVASRHRISPEAQSAGRGARLGAAPRQDFRASP